MLQVKDDDNLGVFRKVMKGNPFCLQIKVGVEKNKTIGVTSQ